MYNVHIVKGPLCKSQSTNNLDVINGFLRKNAVASRLSNTRLAWRKSLKQRYQKSLFVEGKISML